MRSLSGYLLFDHSATDPFNSGTLPSTDSGTGWHFLPERHYYSPLVMRLRGLSLTGEVSNSVP